MANDSSAEDSLKELRKQITARLNELDGDVAFWRPRAFLGHISIATLGALITVIAGLKTSAWTPPGWMPQIFLERENWVLVFGASITVISAWQAFYSHRDRWLSYAASAERLRALLAKVEFQLRLPNSNDPDRAQKLFDEFGTILSELNRIEVTALQKKDDKGAVTDTGG
jgi:hypothetical protein